MLFFYQLAAGLAAEAPLVSLMASVLAFFGMMGAFCYYFHWRPDVYSSKTWLAAPCGRLFDHPGGHKVGLIRWIRPLLVNQETVLQRGGLDVYLFVRYLALIIKMGALLTTTVGPLLLVVYYNGRGDGVGLDVFTNGNIGADRDVLAWVLVLVCWAITIVTCLLLRHELNKMYMARRAWLDTKENTAKPSCRTVILRNPPKKARSKAWLQEHVFKDFPISHITMSDDYSDLVGCDAIRAKWTDKYEEGVLELQGLAQRDFQRIFTSVTVDEWNDYANSLAHGINPTSDSEVLPIIPYQPHSRSSSLAAEDHTNMSSDTASLSDESETRSTTSSIGPEHRSSISNASDTASDNASDTTIKQEYQFVYGAPESMFQFYKHYGGHDGAMSSKLDHASTSTPSVNSAVTVLVTTPTGRKTHTTQARRKKHKIVAFKGGVFPTNVQHHWNYYLFMKHAWITETNIVRNKERKAAYEKYHSFMDTQRRQAITYGLDVSDMQLYRAFVKTVLFEEQRSRRPSRLFEDVALEIDNIDAFHSYVETGARLYPNHENALDDYKHYMIEPELNIDDLESRLSVKVHCCDNPVSYPNHTFHVDFAKLNKDLDRFVAAAGLMEHDLHRRAHVAEDLRENNDLLNSDNDTKDDTNDDMDHGMDQNVGPPLHVHGPKCTLAAARRGALVHGWDLDKMRKDFHRFLHAAVKKGKVARRRLAREEIEHATDVANSNQVTNPATPRYYDIPGAQTPEAKQDKNSLTMAAIENWLALPWIDDRSNFVRVDGTRRFARFSISESSMSEAEHVEDDHVEDDHVEDGHVEDDHVEDDHVEDGHVEEDHVEEGHVEGSHIEASHVEEDQVKDDHVEDDHVEEENVEDDHVEAHIHAQSDGPDLPSTQDEEPVVDPRTRQLWHEYMACRPADEPEEPEPIVAFFEHTVSEDPSEERKYILHKCCSDPGRQTEWLPCDYDWALTRSPSDYGPGMTTYFTFDRTVDPDQVAEQSRMRKTDKVKGMPFREIHAYIDDTIAKCEGDWLDVVSLKLDVDGFLGVWRDEDGWLKDWNDLHEVRAVWWYDSWHTQRIEAWIKEAITKSDDDWFDDNGFLRDNDGWLIDCREDDSIPKDTRSHILNEHHDGKRTSAVYMDAQDWAHDLRTHTEILYEKLTDLPLPYVGNLVKAGIAFVEQYFRSRETSNSSSYDSDSLDDDEYYLLHAATTRRKLLSLAVPWVGERYEEAVVTPRTRHLWYDYMAGRLQKHRDAQKRDLGKEPFQYGWRKYIDEWRYDKLIGYPRDQIGQADDQLKENMLFLEARRQMVHIFVTFQYPRDAETAIMMLLPGGLENVLVETVLDPKDVLWDMLAARVPVRIKSATSRILPSLIQTFLLLAVTIPFVWNFFYSRMVFYFRGSRVFHFRVLFDCLLPYLIFTAYPIMRLFYLNVAKAQRYESPIISNVQLDCRVYTMELAMYLAWQLWQNSDSSTWGILAPPTDDGVLAFLASALPAMSINGNKMIFTLIVTALRVTSQGFLRPNAITRQGRKLTTPRQLGVDEVIPPIDWSSHYTEATTPLLLGLLFGLCTPLLFPSVFMALVMTSTMHLWTIIYVESAPYETLGVFFRRSINHLYMGLHLMHLVLVVVFWKSQAYFKVFVIFSATVYAFYARLRAWRFTDYRLQFLEDFPAMNLDRTLRGRKRLIDLPPRERQTITKNAYVHPGAKVRYHGQVWLARDQTGIAEEEMIRNKKHPYVRTVKRPREPKEIRCVMPTVSTGAAVGYNGRIIIEKKPEPGHNPLDDVVL